jgi:hypothetical protein
MTQSSVISHRSRKEVMQPRRDWILLPLLSLLTICLLAGSTELIARRMFSKSSTGVETCMTTKGPSVGPHGIPNAVCWDKGPETARTKYVLNSCGYRAGVECGLKQPGTYRIVMVGSSFAMGQWVPQEKSLAALLPVELSRATKRKIELYNEGMMSEHPQVVALRSDEVLAAKPDMILWVLMPYDIGMVSADPATMHADTGKAGLLARILFHVKVEFATQSVSASAADLWHRALDHFLKSQVGVLLQHYLYESQSQYVRSYLMGRDPNQGFLRTEPSVQWRINLQEFERDAAAIEGQAKAAGVPLAAVLVPDRAQAAMISMGVWPTGFDPYKLNDELRPIIVRHGGIYIDILRDFRNIPNSEQFYFPVDSHPDARGHAIISELLARELTNGSVPALKITGQPQAVLEQGR